jgi:hypothetical protein
VLQLSGRGWTQSGIASYRSSDFLEEPPKLGGRGYQLDDWIDRTIPKAVLRVAGNVYEIPRTSRDPMRFRTRIGEYLYLP